MTYIYDVLLNFNKNLIEYFEWEDDDNIKYLKKVLVIKISSNAIKDVINKEIIFEEEFVNKIPKYEMNKNKKTKRACIFTDGFISIGVLIKEKSPILYSRMLIDEEKEVLEMVNLLPIKNINYKVIKSKEKEDTTLTRNERKVKKKVITEIKKMFEEKKYDKLLYIYYEITNDENKSIKNAYRYLIEKKYIPEDKYQDIYKILSIPKSLKDK